MDELAHRAHASVRRGEWSLPPPGGGGTGERHTRLMQVGREDLSLARIAEAHSDALAILAEAGRTAQLPFLYGVWASDGPASRLTASRETDGGWRLTGCKQYCSGATFVDAALVTAHLTDGVGLFEIRLDDDGIAPLDTAAGKPWKSPFLADTLTTAVSFAGVKVPAAARVGGCNWYLDRPGFWHGAIGPAACWAGGALSLIEAAKAQSRRDPHSLAHVGALEAIAWGCQAVLAQCAEEIDEDPADGRRARTRALKVRHLIERWCTEVLDRLGRATGPQLLAFDETVIRQYGALTVYIRQCHAERDLAAIAESS